MIVDQNVEMVHDAADKLIRRHGGFDGWVKHLQVLDRQRAARLKKKQAAKKPRVATPKKLAKKKAKR